MTLYLIVRVAAETVALPAVNVASVVEVDAVAPVPLVAPHVAGLFALRSRVLTVIDTRASLQLGSIDLAGDMKAVIVEHDGHSYALLVDEIEDVVEGSAADSCPALIGSAWQRATLGTIPHEGRALLLLSPAALVAGPDQLAA